MHHVFKSSLREIIPPPPGGDGDCLVLSPSPAIVKCADRPLGSVIMEVFQSDLGNGNGNSQYVQFASDGGVFSFQLLLQSPPPRPRRRGRHGTTLLLPAYHSPLS
jgi:hypothetical protein